MGKETIPSVTILLSLHFFNSLSVLRNFVFIYFEICVLVITAFCTSGHSSKLHIGRFNNIFFSDFQLLSCVKNEKTKYAKLNMCLKGNKSKLFFKNNLLQSAEKSLSVF